MNTFILLMRKNHIPYETSAPRFPPCFLMGFCRLASLGYAKLVPSTSERENHESEPSSAPHASKTDVRSIAFFYIFIDKVGRISPIHSVVRKGCRLAGQRNRAMDCNSAEAAFVCAFQVRC